MTDEATAWRDAAFRKSSFSGSSGGNCVEIARAESRFGMRDSKNPFGPVLAVAVDRGHMFLAMIRREQITAP